LFVHAVCLVLPACFAAGEVESERAATMPVSQPVEAGDQVISVFDPRVQREGEWALQEKRLSGFRRSLMPAAADATLELTFEGEAVSLLRGSPWRAWPTSAGQAFGVRGDDVVPRPASAIRGSLVVGIDGGKSRRFGLRNAPVEIPLADNLAPGPHRLKLIFPQRSRLTVIGFRATHGPRGAVSLKVTADAQDYLNDVSVGIHRDGELIDRRLARNPNTGDLLVWGLPPGRYDLHLCALGWQDAWLRDVRVEAGSTTRLPDCHLAADPLALPRGSIAQPNRGYPAYTKPGELLPVVQSGRAEAADFKAALVSSWREYVAAVESATFDADNSQWRLGVRVPTDVSDGLYHLRMSHSMGTDQAVCAVAVRRQIGPTFRVVKFGHMDTWTQRNAEYLRLLVELTNLIHPDLLLVGNEVNWQYVAGALAACEVPYMTTSGNHSLPGFERYFGPAVGWIRAGDVFIANSCGRWRDQADELEAAFAHAAGARYRILQGFEYDLPAELARKLDVDFYAFGHGFSNQSADQRDEQGSAAGLPWLHLGKEFHLVTIDLATGKATAAGVGTSLSGMAVKYPIPRHEPWSPVVFDPPADGRAGIVRATVRNPLTVALDSARVRFVMPAGAYAPSVGRVVRSTLSVDGKQTEVIVEVDVPARSTVEVTLGPANE